MNSSPGPCALRVTSPSGTQSHIFMQIRPHRAATTVRAKSICHHPPRLPRCSGTAKVRLRRRVPCPSQAGSEPLLCRITVRCFKGAPGIVRHQGMAGRAHAGIGARVVHRASCSAPYCPAAWGRRDLAPYLPNRTAPGAGSLHDACAPFPHGFSRLQKFIVQSRTCQNVALPRSIIAKGYVL